MTENEIAKEIVDVAYRIHVSLGPGLLESIYERIMVHELRKRGLAVETQKEIPIDWDGKRIGTGFRADIIVEEKVIVELKSVEEISPLHRKQLQTYLNLTGKRLGLLVNFNVPYIKDGIKRVVNKLPE